MQINIGLKIKELRKRDGRTQEAMANALGVTSQAISRWEANGGYPDMEIIPAIANYFHVTIDELFGYSEDRTKRIEAILKKAETAIKAQEDMTECVEMLREVEYPTEYSPATINPDFWKIWQTILPPELLETVKNEAKYSEYFS